MMNKIEQMHLDCISEVYLDSFDEGGHTDLMDCEKAASESAEITEKIAIEFVTWLWREIPEEAMAQESWEYWWNEWLKTKQ